MILMHIKKMIAPIVVSLIFIAYFVFYFAILVTELTGIVRILFGVVPLLLIGVMIYVCAERIKEIRKGEEDDLSQY